MLSINKLQLLALTFVALFGLSVSADAQTVTASDESIGTTGTANVTVTLDTTEVVRGISLGLVHDSKIVSLASIDMGSDLSGLNAGDGPDFYESVTDADNGPGGFIACIVDFELVEEIPAEDGQEMAVFNYDAVAEGTSDITFSDDLGEPPVRTVLVSDAESVVPTKVDGSVEVADSDEVEFLRGDADNSGDVFPILDALYILEYGFTNGPVPACLDAADVDGNNVVFPIIDALYVLEYGFTNGPAPPDPGPTVCGPDDDLDDDVTCLEGPAFCA